ncbi:MAG: phosphonate C-P lyase system protein PhnG [Pseudomonadota bacterium]
MTPDEDRKSWMSLLAKSPADMLQQLWDGFEGVEPHTFLRAPEAGGVMVRGRTGATGAPFNLGEMTVTRCSLKLPGGQVGHGYVQGRDKAHATRAALVDAHMQTDIAPKLRRAVLDPLEASMTAARNTRAAKAAATKVDFFTLARGED